MRYKRVDVAVQAFTSLGLPLRIVGVGEDMARLKRMAGPNIEFLGQCADDQLADLYRNSLALVFPSDDDFGITPLEAMASGRPVIALAAGGAMETVVEGVTGHFFYAQTPKSLSQEVLGHDYAAFDSLTIRRHAERFGLAQFQEKVRMEIDRAMEVGSSKERKRERSLLTTRVR
jgi:glycosyltransferase involved in cell wall biosynthesis